MTNKNIIKGEEAIKLLNAQCDEEEYDRLVLVLKIGQLIKDRGITQKQLAKMTGMRPNAISNLARGIVERITIDHIERIANALNVSDINEMITLDLESEVMNMGNRKEQEELDKYLNESENK